MGLQIKIVHDGARNASVQITGTGMYEWRSIVDLDALSPRPKEVRLDAVYYAMSDKLEAQLAWHSDESDRTPFLPLGGRGKIDFSEVSGLHNNAPDKSGHIEMRVVGDNKEGIFTLVLDLSKHLGVQNG